MATGDDTKTRRFIFLLLDRLSLLAFASAIEPLRIANRMSERELYSWSFASETGQPVTSSCRATIAVDHGLEEAPRDATILVCSGIDVHRTVNRSRKTHHLTDGLNDASLVMGKHHRNEGNVIASTRRAWIGRPINEVMPHYDLNSAQEAIKQRRAGLIVECCRRVQAPEYVIGN